MWNQLAPRLSVAAQQDSNNLLVVGVLIVALIVVLVLFWRLSRKPARSPAATAEPAASDAGKPLEAAAASMLATLEFTNTSNQPVSFDVDKPALTLGRAPDNDVVIVDPIANADSVSLHHARLRRDQDEYIVRDLGSKNGVTVNGRHTIENVLQDGDRIGFGAAEAVFHNGKGGTP